MAKRKRRKRLPVKAASVEVMGKPGRPKKEIDPEQVFRLAHIHCTVNEIASVLDCNPDTIYARFSEVLRRGHEDGQMSLKRKMHEVAFNGDTKMLIWLSKQRLGYKDVMPEEVAQVTFNVYTNEVPK